VLVKVRTVKVPLMLELGEQAGLVAKAGPARAMVPSTTATATLDATRLRLLTEV
jgi:hypothetical protein